MMADEETVNPKVVEIKKILEEYEALCKKVAQEKKTSVPTLYTRNKIDIFKEQTTKIEELKGKLIRVFDSMDAGAKQDLVEKHAEIITLLTKEKIEVEKILVTSTKASISTIVPFPNLIESDELHRILPSLKTRKMFG